MKVCDVTGKGKQFGNNVSFSQRHTKKVWHPNLQKKTLIIDGKKVRMKVSTSALRTLKKKGIIEAKPHAQAESKAAKAYK